MVDVDVHVLNHLKDELSWAADKRLWVISTIIYFLKSCRTRELKGTQHFNIVYAAMWPLVMYSNCFEIILL